MLNNIKTQSQKHKINIFAFSIILSLFICLFIWFTNIIFDDYKNNMQYLHVIDQRISSINKKLNILSNNEPEIIQKVIKSCITQDHEWVKRLKLQIANIQSSHSLNEPIRISIKNPIEIQGTSPDWGIKLNQIEFYININKAENIIPIIKQIKGVINHNSVLTYMEILDSTIKPDLIYQYISDQAYYSRLVFNIYIPYKITNKVELQKKQ